MRVSKNNGHLRVKAAAGTHVAPVALDAEEDAHPGLRGLAIKPGRKDQPAAATYAHHVFRGAGPKPQREPRFQS